MYNSVFMSNHNRTKLFLYLLLLLAAILVIYYLGLEDDAPLRTKVRYFIRNLLKSF